MNHLAGRASSHRPHRLHERNKMQISSNVKPSFYSCFATYIKTVSTDFSQRWYLSFEEWFFCDSLCQKVWRCLCFRPVRVNMLPLFSLWDRSHMRRASRCVIPAWVCPHTAARQISPSFFDLGCDTVHRHRDLCSLLSLTVCQVN